MSNKKRTRAVLFIDGSNWYHALKSIGVSSNSFHYPTFAQELVLDREVCGIRYYVGKVLTPPHERAKQERFIDSLKSQNVRVILGRIEQKRMSPKRNQVIKEISALLANPENKIPTNIATALDGLRRREIPYQTEKQVDVHIAVDLVSCAYRDEYDVAYLLSADGDFVPAVKEAKRQGKKVFVAGPVAGKQIREAADAFIPIKSERFWRC